jgi:hypothetical protein
MREVIVSMKRFEQIFLILIKKDLNDEGKLIRIFCFKSNQFFTSILNK